MEPGERSEMKTLFSVDLLTLRAILVAHYAIQGG